MTDERAQSKDIRKQAQVDKRIAKKQVQVDKKFVKKADKHLHGAYDSSVGTPLSPRGRLTLHHGMVSFWDAGTTHVRSVVGAVAEFDIGASRTRGPRSTLTRVAVGGVVGGKTGAIVGGQFQKGQKDLTQVFVTVTWPDGGWAQGMAPAASEPVARQATQRINAASKFYATFDQPLPLLRSASKTMTVSLYLDHLEWATENNEVESIAIPDIASAKAPTAFGNPSISVTTTSGRAVELSVMRSDGVHIAGILNEILAGKHPDLHVQNQASAPAPTLVSAAATDPAVQLQQLAGLRDAGILTEEEFSAKKSEILARM